MKQIFSWTIGSFFRTIGRTLALLGMGALIYFILSRLGFGVKDLFFDNVKADTFTSFNTNGVNSSDWSNSSLNNYVKRSYTNNSNVNHAITFNNNITKNSIQRIQINGYFSGLGTGEVSTYFRCTSYTNTGTCANWETYNNSYQWFNFQIFLDNKTEQCTIEWNLPNLNTNQETQYVFWSATCYTHTIQQISYSLNYYNSTLGSSHTIEMGLAKIVKYFESDSTPIIENQNQNTQTIIEQQQNSTQQMLDTNSTSTDEKADSFFNNSAFEDTGGLSSIITAPLSMINSMLNNTYSMPCATWKGAQICLPGGDMLWSRPGAADLKNLLNVFYGGVVCYYAIRKLFLMIERMKDPTSDNIEVTDL